VRQLAVDLRHLAQPQGSVGLIVALVHEDWIRFVCGIAQESVMSDIPPFSVHQWQLIELALTGKLRDRAICLGEDPNQVAMMTWVLSEDRPSKIVHVDFS
jgi:hypothetical protein